MKLNSLPQTIAILVAISLTSLTSADEARYRLTFDATWSESTHPVDYPENAHFSGTLGLTHNADFSLWSPGELSTPGIKVIAETGRTEPLNEEVQAAIDAGTGFRSLRLSGFSTTPLAQSVEFVASSTHPLVSFTSMIAPSPDWIVGVHDIPLKADGLWIPNISMEAWPYDAGTDSGESFRSGDVVTDPAQPIFLLDDGVLEDTPSFGTFSLELISMPGDFNTSGNIDVEDIDVICFRLGQSQPRIELTGDDTLGLDDVNQLITGIIGTRPGDVDLDGNVDFEDFLVVANNFGGTGNWTNGDFDCNRQINFQDFLTLAENFGYSASEEMVAAASVPEPTTFSLAFLASIFVALRTRRKH